MTNHKPTPSVYRAKIGRLDTRQFTILQQYLTKVNEMERIAMLYRQLELEIEMETDEE